MLIPKNVNRYWKAIDEIPTNTITGKVGGSTGDYLVVSDVGNLYHAHHCLGKWDWQGLPEGEKIIAWLDWYVLPGLPSDLFDDCKDVRGVS